MRRVAGTDDREVTVIDRCDGPNLEALRDRDYCRVHYPETEFDVGRHEVSHPVQVLSAEPLEGNAVSRHLAHEGYFGLLASKFADQVAGLGEDNLGHDQLLCGGIEERRAASMVRVVRNRCRYERSCVDDDYRPNSSSRWSLSNRSASATLNAPGLARTIPMKPYR